MQIEKGQHTAKAHTTCIFGPRSRLLIVFFAATVPLTLPAIVLAQQSAKPGRQTQGDQDARGKNQHE